MYYSVRVAAESASPQGDVKLTEQGGPRGHTTGCCCVAAALQDAEPSAVKNWRCEKVILPIKVLLI